LLVQKFSFFGFPGFGNLPDILLTAVWVII
jgi:hypothetical protein